MKSVSVPTASTEDNRWDGKGTVVCIEVCSPSGSPLRSQNFLGIQFTPIMNKRIPICQIVNGYSNFEVAHHM